MTGEEGEEGEEEEVKACEGGRTESVEEREYGLHSLEAGMK